MAGRHLCGQSERLRRCTPSGLFHSNALRKRLPSSRAIPNAGDKKNCRPPVRPDLCGAPAGESLQSEDGRSRAADDP